MEDVLAHFQQIFHVKITLNVTRIYTCFLWKDCTTELFKEIFLLRWNRLFLQRITRRYDEGFFSVTFKDIESKEKYEKLCEGERKKGSMCFTIVQETPNKEQKLKVGNLPEEVPTKVIKSYLSKYLMNPEVKLETIDFGEGTIIETGRAEVSFNGLRRMLWMGPGVTATVISKFKIQCSQFNGKDHKGWECDKNNTCYRCNMHHVLFWCDFVSDTWYIFS